jgi:hypothetical protein
MRHAFRAAFIGALAVVIVVVFTSNIDAGQASSAGANANAAAAKYKAPRTPDGQPDLQGVWANNDATPLERPKELAGRTTLTEQEVAALKARAGELFNGETDAAFGDSVFLAVLRSVNSKDKDFKSTDTTGNYNHFWIVDREFDNRTAVVSNPADGRIPPLTPLAEKLRADAAEYRRQHPADGPEDLPLSHRCVTFGVPRLGAGYNSYFQIIQSKEYVAIAQEMIHDVRIIPLDNRPHLPGSVTQWHGDSRARWDGDTLVVETKNYSPLARFQNLPSDTLTTTERFTRIGPKTIQWDVTVNDPKMYTRPWTASVMLRSTTDQVYEMACHEGNEGLPGALSGHRAQERKAEAAAKAGSR